MAADPDAKTQKLMLRKRIASRIQDAPCELPWNFQVAGWHGKCTLRLFNGRIMFGLSDLGGGASQGSTLASRKSAPYEVAKQARK